MEDLEAENKRYREALEKIGLIANARDEFPFGQIAIIVKDTLMDYETVGGPKK